jgi:hypothetical protein
MAALIEEQRATTLPPLPKRFPYHAVFSYASADAEYVRAVHAALPEDVKAFDYAEDGMWGKVLVKGLEHVGVRRGRTQCANCS